jgi:hypothetical protein
MADKSLTKGDIDKLIFFVKSYASGDTVLIAKLKACKAVIAWRDNNKVA